MIPVCVGLAIAQFIAGIICTFGFTSDYRKATSDEERANQSKNVKISVLIMLTAPLSVLSLFLLLFLGGYKAFKYVQPAFLNKG